MRNAPGEKDVRHDLRTFYAVIAAAQPASSTGPRHVQRTRAGTMATLRSDGRATWTRRDGARAARLDDAHLRDDRRQGCGDGSAAISARATGNSRSGCIAPRLDQTGPVDSGST
jgi:hypothetical protein